MPSKVTGPSHKCRICGRTFPTKPKLDAHVRRAHAKAPEHRREPLRSRGTDHPGAYGEPPGWGGTIDRVER